MARAALSLIALIAALILAAGSSDSPKSEKKEWQPGTTRDAAPPPETPAAEPGGSPLQRSGGTTSLDYSEPAVPELEVLDYTSEVDEYGVRYVVGLVRNNTYATLSYVQVTIGLYGPGGMRVGSTLDNVNNLGPGETWKFRAMVFEDEATRFEIDDVEGF